jgi:hypothetical protein
MYEIDRRRCQMLARVRDFGSRYGHLLPESSLARQSFAAVTTRLQEIDAYDLAETSALVSARAARKVAARKALLDRLVLVGKSARVLSGGDATVWALFELPESPGDRTLLTTARQFVAHAAPLAAQFIAHGMAPTFPADLGTLVERFEDALRDRSMSRAEQVAARIQLKTSLSKALAAVRTLDAIVSNHLASDLVIRELWTRSRRIEYPWARWEPRSAR